MARIPHLWAASSRCQSPVRLHPRGPLLDSELDTGEAAEILWSHCHVQETLELTCGALNMCHTCSAVEAVAFEQWLMVLMGKGVNPHTTPLPPQVWLCLWIHSFDKFSPLHFHQISRFITVKVTKVKFVPMRFDNFAEAPDLNLLDSVHHTAVTWLADRIITWIGSYTDVPNKVCSYCDYIYI